MNVATKSRLNVSRLSPHIGAEVRDIDLSQTLDASTIADIHDACLDHALVVRHERLHQALTWFSRRRINVLIAHYQKHVFHDQLLLVGRHGPVGHRQ